tara:strand:+ start:358 stop:573 length:216 start_codon:yes stop_codon:yes gene_type:complete
MKDIKSFIIGFLSCACLFLLIGASGNQASDRYHGFASDKHQVYRINTFTGELEMKKVKGLGKNEIGWWKLP